MYYICGFITLNAADFYYVCGLLHLLTFFHWQVLQSIMQIMAENTCAHMNHIGIGKFSWIIKLLKPADSD